MTGAGPMSIKASVPIPIETMERLDSQSASDPPSIRPRPSWKLAVVDAGGAAPGRTAGDAGHADRSQRTAHPRLARQLTMLKDWVPMLS